ALIAECERLASEAGYRRIGLGVAHENEAAARLYRRLGYAGDFQYRDRYSCVDSLGTRHYFADPATFVVKSLAWLLSRSGTLGQRAPRGTNPVTSRMHYAAYLAGQIR